MFYLDTLSTLVAATLVLLLGRKLVQSVSFLKKYTIPEPVAGGLLVASIQLAISAGAAGGGAVFDLNGASGVFVGSGVLLVSAMVIVLFAVRVKPVVSEE